MTAPRVSLVLPTYNHLAFLPQAVATALDQTVDGFELIIVNDGSTDDSRAWLDALRDPRVRVIHQANAGPAEAINTGIRAAQGEYLSWISADNRCTRYFVEAFVAALDTAPDCALAYSPYYTIDGEDRIEGVKFDNLLLLRELVTVRPRGLAGFMYRRALQADVGPYEGWACDTLMWARIMARHAAVFVLEPTYYYRFHNERATVAQNAKVRQAYSGITADYLQRTGPLNDDAMARLYPGLPKLPRQATAAKADFAAQLARCGFKPEARDLLAEALAAAPANELLRPLVNAVGLCLVMEEDPIAFVTAALARNSTLPPDAVAAGMDVADAVAALARAGGEAEYLVLELGSLLTALEKPKVFSFTAWKHDPAATPVRGV